MAKKSDIKEPRPAIEGIEESRYEEVFTSFKMNDNAGNLLTIKPWSLDQTKPCSKIVAKIYKQIKEVVSQDPLSDAWQQIDDFNIYFRRHLDHFFQYFVDELCTLICLTLNKNEKEVLPHLDHAKALVILDVIWQQNFTGPRVTDQILRFVQVGNAPEASPSESQTDLTLPGNI